ncbi:MAG: hypothetical protein F6K19_49435 [Cyanothece sp. SIO1E1]|nr:hypothetical protein [Cyanothece sp. SIO1E1]
MQDTQRDLIKLSEDIYNSYGVSDSTGLTYFAKFTSRLEQFDYREVLVYQVKTYPSRYVFDFLLSIPFLWADMSGDDWMEVMRRLNPRPKPFEISNDEKYFSDIHFLCKYIGVDAVQFFLKQDSFSRTDKLHVLQYCLKETCFFSIDEIDLEDLDGSYFMHKDEVREVKERLINSGHFKGFDLSEDEFISYLEQQRVAIR